MKPILLICHLLLACILQAQQPPEKILVYSSTQANAIPATTKSTIVQLAAQQSFQTEYTNNQTKLTTISQDTHPLVILLQVKEPISTKAINHLKTYVKQGGGLLVIHSKISNADYLGGHTTTLSTVQQPAIAAKNHASTYFLKDNWAVKDKAYAVTNYSHQNQLLLGTSSTPISWATALGKGNIFCTVLGGTADIYTNPNFKKHLQGALLYCLQYM